MLLPVTLLLLGMGYVGFIYAKNSLFIQWREATTLKLQRAAHHVDMRLGAPKELLKVFQKTADKPNAHYIQEAIIEQLKLIDSVARINLTWEGEEQGQYDHTAEELNRDRKAPLDIMKTSSAMMRFHQAGLLGVTPPTYDSLIENDTISLISELKDVNGQTVGKLEVVLRFDSIIDIEDSSWWDDQKAFLVDNTGKAIAGNYPKAFRDQDGAGTILGPETLRTLKEESFGTVFKKDQSLSKVIGFYRLREAPWTLVVIALGKDILGPITSFQFYYLLTSAFFILFILLLIRWVTGRTVSSIKDVSRASKKLAQGEYGDLLQVKTHDEVGELIHNFNTMVTQLKERVQLKTALNLAMEVQQNLLPRKIPEVDGLDIAGTSIYCDEIGGDYYDFINIGGHEKENIGVVVGDVSDHGIPSALLMATARAFLRQSATISSSLVRIITDVNVQLCQDVEDSGRFMSMFLLSINMSDRSLRWVRAGHDPAIVYDPETDTFEDLCGAGLTLGVDQEYQYVEHIKHGSRMGQIILLGTDGLWEAANTKGKMFGKKPIYNTIRRNHGATAQEIMNAILAEVKQFQEECEQEDDITLVVIKNTSNCC